MLIRQLTPALGAPHNYLTSPIGHLHPIGDCAYTSPHLSKTSLLTFSFSHSPPVALLAQSSFFLFLFRIHSTLLLT